MKNFFNLFHSTIDSLLGNFELWNNTGTDYFYALLIFISFFFVLQIIKSILLIRMSQWAAKTKTLIDDHLVELLQGISPFALLWIAFYFIINFVLTTNEQVKGIIAAILIILLVSESIKIVTKLLTYSFNRKTNGDPTTLNAIRIVIKIVLWIVGALLILSNLGFDVTTLVASLGVGGIAIALAAQTVLQDLFASFSIFFDKPFKIGDFIVIGTDQGTVRKIGMKTTRIETLQGEELIVANKELTTARVQNFKRMRHRRVDFSIGLVYGTSSQKIKEATSLIKKIIDQDERTQFMRAHFKSFGDFSLNIAITYKILSNDIEEYLNTQESINLQIIEAFETAELEMAFPTQTLHIVK